MSLLKKQVNDEVIKDVDLMGMTYTEFVSQELNNEVNKLVEVKGKIKKITEEIIEDIKENGETHALKTKFLELLEKEKNNDIEIEKTKSKYGVDLNLLVLAGELDEADMKNKGIDLIWELGPKINEMLASLPIIEKCFGSDINTPYPYIAIKKALIGLPIAMNSNLSMLVKVDKEKLIQRFNKEVAALEKKKKEAQKMKDKYIL